MFQDIHVASRTQCVPLRLGICSAVFFFECEPLHVTCVNFELHRSDLRCDEKPMTLLLPSSGGLWLQVTTRPTSYDLIIIATAQLIQFVFRRRNGHGLAMSHLSTASGNGSSCSSSSSGCGGGDDDWLISPCYAVDDSTRFLTVACSESRHNSISTRRIGADFGGVATRGPWISSHGDACADADEGRLGAELAAATSARRGARPRPWRLQRASMSEKRDGATCRMGPDSRNRRTPDADCVHVENVHDRTEYGYISDVAGSQSPCCP